MEFQIPTTETAGRKVPEIKHSLLISERLFL